MELTTFYLLLNHSAVDQSMAEGIMLDVWILHTGGESSSKVRICRFEINHS